MRQNMRLVKWVQISDIHIMENDDVVTNQLRENIINEISRIRNLDCVIITGDFFFKGKVNFDWLKNFLEQIKSRVNKKIFFCPGNHDVNRNATLYDAKTSRIIVRDEIVQNSRNSEGDFLDNNQPQELKLLTETSFSYFYQIMDKILGDEKKRENFEYDIFPLNKNDGNADPVFIALNTELLSGQRRSKEDIRNCIEKESKEISKALLSGNTDKLKASLSRYLDAYKELQDGVPVDDNLCFISLKSVRDICSYINASMNMPVIVFGHRPITQMPNIIQQRFRSFMESIGSKIYLCGHEHKVGVHEVNIAIPETNSYTFYQITVGGSFTDQSHYNKCSFAVCELIQEPVQNALLLKTELYLWNKRFSEYDIEGYDSNAAGNRPFEWETVKLKDLTVAYTNNLASDILFESSKSILEKKDESRDFKKRDNEDDNLRNIDLSSTEIGNPKKNDLYDSHKEF